MKNIQLPQITTDRLLKLDVGDSGYIIIPAEDIERDFLYIDEGRNPIYVNLISYSPLQQGDKFYIGEEFAIYENPFGTQEIVSYGTWKSNLYVGDKSEVQPADQMQPRQSRFHGTCLSVEVTSINWQEYLNNHKDSYSFGEEYMDILVDQHNILHKTNIVPSMKDYVFLVEVRRNK